MSMGNWAATAQLNRFGDLDVRLTPAGSEAAAGADKDAFSAAAADVIRDAARFTGRGCTLIVRGAEQAAAVVPIALSHGFRFHRAMGDEVVMRFFSKTSQAAAQHGGDPLPAAAHVQVATGGVVFNAAGEVLLIRQTYDRHAEWRLPGGALDPEETLVEGAAREVGEETGVRVRPLGLVGLRQAPQYRSIFGTGFLGASVLFEVEGDGSGAAEALRWPAEEILEARWVPLEQALRPFPSDRESDAAVAEGDDEATALARARAVSDTVAHGMTRSPWQRVSVVRGALLRGLGGRIPPRALREAVDGGCVTEAEAAAALGASGPGPALLREVFHPTGFPHGRQGGAWYAMIPGRA